MNEYKGTTSLHFFSFLLSAFLAIDAIAQNNLEDWTYTKHAVNERKVVPHRPSREASVRFNKRIDRIIDVREKQNLPMHWQRNALYDIMFCAMRDPDCTYGPLNVYTSDSLDKGQKYSKQQLDSLGSTTYVTSVPCPGGYCDTTIFVPFVPRNIKKYRVVEEWIFDHTYSDYRPYIIAIAPMHSPTAAGIQLNESALFWIKMDEFRPILVNQEIFNPYNDAARLSFDDWFEMRMFSSHIVKESNVFDLDVKYMPEFEDDGLAALLQAEKIKNDLFVFEHDLWEY